MNPNNSGKDTWLQVENENEIESSLFLAVQHDIYHRINVEIKIDLRIN